MYADLSYIWEAFWNSSSILYPVILWIPATPVQCEDQQNEPHPNLLEMQNCRHGPRGTKLEAAFYQHPQVIHPQMFEWYFCK